MNAPLPSNLVLNSTEERALNLLGQGIDPGTVASAIGVSDALISQMLSRAEFVSLVSERRYTSLAKYAERDNKYDQTEDTLLEKLNDCIPYMLDPMKILAALRVINAAKRRGAGIQPTEMNKAPVVRLTLPIQIVNMFKMDANNQVIQAGEQNLVTIQAGSLTPLLESQSKGNGNVEIQPSRTG